MLSMLETDMIDPALEVAVGTLMHDVGRNIILANFTPGRRLEAEFKTPGEAVTAIDHASEDALTESLARMLPGVAVVGEESVHADPALLRHLSRGSCWIIDPLDGTGHYAAGTGPFGILVALAHDGVPLAGWILDPLSGRLCTASRGRGARINGESFRVAARGKGRPRIALTQLFHDEVARAALVEELAAANEVVAAPRCAADIYPRVVTGELDAALFTRTIAWDHAAGIVFLNEAGGRAARPDGRPYNCGDPAGGLISAIDPACFTALADRIGTLGVPLTYSMA